MYYIGEFTIPGVVQNNTIFVEFLFVVHKSKETHFILASFRMEELEKEDHCFSREQLLHQSDGLSFHVSV